MKCSECNKSAVYVAYGDDCATAFCLEHMPKMKWEGDLLKERPAMASDFWIADARANCSQVVDSSETTEKK